jgi:hypothetical protein
MKKLCARWVPRLLTDQKRIRMKMSEQCLESFNKNKTDFVRRFITMDETWIHHYTRIQTAFKTVGRNRLFSAKGERVIQGHGIGVLEC